jgi:hypothetical protein
MQPETALLALLGGLVKSADSTDVAEDEAAQVEMDVNRPG